MLSTDRGLYCPAEGDETGEARGRRSGSYRYGPYADAPQALGVARMTISAPYVHAASLSALSECLERLGERPARVLDVGCGSGILVACLARMAPPGSIVAGLELIPELVERSADNLSADGFQVLRGDAALDRDLSGVRVLHGDGWVGAEALGPWDAVHVGAGASRIPDALVRQLAPGGVLVIPVGAEQSNQRHIALSRDLATGAIQERMISEAPVRFIPLLERGSRMGKRHKQGLPPSLRGAEPGGVDWDERYRKGWAYGKSPSSFLAASAGFIDNRSHACAVSLGEGQGRNAVYLAETFASMRVLALDESTVGLKKCRALAKERGVADRVETRALDLTQYNPEHETVDVLVSIFCALDDRLAQRELHRRCALALRPGGVVIMECFSPAHAQLRESGAAGTVVPGPMLAQQLVSPESLEDDFSGFHVLVREDVETVLLEGNYHRGLARLTHFVGRKPFPSNAPRPLDFGKRVDAIFSAARHPTGWPPADKLEPDQLLAHAPALVKEACLAAERSSLCRGCWTAPAQCTCAQTSNRHNKGGSPPDVNFVVCTHPAEFLRSTSSARAAVQHLAGAAELLVFGDVDSERRLDYVIGKACGDESVNCILYPFCPAPDGTRSPGPATLDVTSLRLLSESASPSRKRTVTVIVPDGSWRMSEALTRRILKRGIELGVSPAELPCVSLERAAVAQHRSPLIDALKPGKGSGRLSTLEAMALFLHEFGMEEYARRLHESLVPLTDRVSRCLRGENFSFKGDLSPSQVASWAEALQSASSRAEGVYFRPGLRLCPVCGENLATSARMREHLLGRRHAIAVARRFLADSNSAEEDEPSIEKADEAYARYSASVIAQIIPEPPDEALAALQTGRGRLALPESLRIPRRLTFDVMSSPLYSSVSQLLAKTQESGYFASPSSSGCSLAAFRVNPAMFESFHARQTLYNAVSKDVDGVCGAYESLVNGVVVPFLRSELRISSADWAAESDLWYQYPPTLRLQPGPCAIGGKEHCDALYGHQPSELNFWLPLTNTRASKSTLVAESAPLRGDFSPLPAGALGEIAAFYGVACRHFAPPNASQEARVSLDFRVGYSAFGFDPNSSCPHEPSTLKRHGWRRALPPGP